MIALEKILNWLKIISFFLTFIILSHVSFAQTKVANDPTRIGVGARILGMGKSYVGLADDLSGMFINPASLALVDNWQVTSMQGNFINEYNYLNFGGAWPTSYGSIGLGYVGSSIGFTAPAATTEVVDGVRVIPSTTEGVSYSFLDSVILFSWGRSLKGLFGLDLFADFSTGAALKFFSLDLSGPGISQGRASGNELDIGLNYRPRSFLKLGLVLQNALPFSAGGGIKWDNGTEETLPSLLKTGLSLRLLGKEGWQKYGKHELTLNLDGDFHPLRSDLPALWHLGLEWSPLRFIDLRAGIDQDYLGAGGGGLEAANNLTAGVGLYFGHFRFDYAYHQYNQLSDNDTHYFSLTYGVTRQGEQEEKTPSFELSPADKTILFTAEVTVKGKVLDRRIRRVLVGRSEVQLLDGAFVIAQPLKLRKNSIVVKGYRGKELAAAEKLRLLRLKRFPDVPPDYWASIPIAALAMAEVVKGYPDGTFRPEAKITRAELTKLLVTLLKKGSRLVTSRPYTDIAPVHWAANQIAYAAGMGLVKGYPDRTFRPAALVSRAEGVTLISRLARLPEPKTLEAPFADVPGRHWAARDIIKAREAGILQYLAGRPFRPNRDLTRAEVVEMLSRTPLLVGKIRDLLDWKRGY